MAEDGTTPEGYMGMLWDVGLHVSPDEDIGDYAIVWRDEFGEKGRFAAEYLDEARIVSDFRGNTTWTGLYKGTRVAVAATNWGCAAASVAVEELANCGVQTFIRFGTIGGLQTEVALGDLIIAEGCVRADGTSVEYLPLEYPAVFNFEVTRALVDAADALGESHHLGIIRTHDAYFVETNESIGRPDGGAGSRAFSHKKRRESRIAPFADAGVLGVDNEGAGTVVPARARGCRSGGFYCCTGNMIRDDEIFPDEAAPRVKSLFRVAFDAIAILEHA